MFLFTSECLQRFAFAVAVQKDADGDENRPGTFEEVHFAFFA